MRWLQALGAGGAADGEGAYLDVVGVAIVERRRSGDFRRKRAVHIDTSLGCAGRHRP